MITYSEETIFHFSCGKCTQWFSIADWDKNETQKLTCPLCGKKQRVEQCQRFEVLN